MMYHNYMKIFREKLRGRDNRTHAETAGIYRELIDKGLKDICTRRRFLSLEDMKGSFMDLWHRDLVTPLKDREEYLPAYAAA